MPDNAKKKKWMPFGHRLGRLLLITSRTLHFAEALGPLKAKFSITQARTRECLNITDVFCNTFSLVEVGHFYDIYV